MLSLLIMRFKLLGLDAPPKHPTQPPPRCHPCPDWASHRLASCSTQFSASHLLPPRLRSPSGRQARVEDLGSLCRRISIRSTATYDRAIHFFFLFQREFRFARRCCTR
uniref:Uncharacterized protein n=1 Tax=Opuntia streptacantha TaxID=393608 RepID=A0A7C9CW56_OPUST